MKYIKKINLNDVMFSEKEIKKIEKTCYEKDKK